MLYLEQDELLTKKGFPLIDDNPSLVKFQEALVQRCSVKKVLLEISHNLQENICARASVLVKLQAFLKPFSIEHVWTRASEYLNARITRTRNTFDLRLSLLF